jgi:glucose uptake protein GlcU
LQNLDQILGFGLALMAMILYGVYMVPRKSSAVSQSTYSFWMGCGILAATLAAGWIAEGKLPIIGLRDYAIIVGSGILWATGTVAYCVGVKNIGLSRSSPIKNTSAILGTLIGIVFFHEFTSGRSMPLLLAIVGSLCIVVSATVLGRVESFDDADVEEGSNSFLIGVVASGWAAVAYSAYTIPMKMAYSHGVSPSAFLFYMGQGCFIGMAALAYILRPRGAQARKEKIHARDRWLAISSGAMWGVGSLCANIAIKLIGIAIAWPVTKNTIVAVVYGVVILKEIDTARHKRDLGFGLFLSLAGVVLLAFAMR